MAEFVFEALMSKNKLSINGSTCLGTSLLIISIQYYHPCSSHLVLRLFKKKIVEHNYLILDHRLFIIYYSTIVIVNALLKTG